MQLNTAAGIIFSTDRILHRNANNLKTETEFSDSDNCNVTVCNLSMQIIYTMHSYSMHYICA